jgi:glutamate-5-semialdehyde dehydrogenase
MRETGETKDVVVTAKRAKAASGLLAQLSTEEKNRAVVAIADNLEECADEIMAANHQDLEAARRLVAAGEMAESMFRRLKMDAEKLSEIVEGVRQVASLEDPVGKVTLATVLDDGLRLYRVSCPIGVIGVIFESRPDALVQISTLCLKSGNSALLKGGREAARSNQALFGVIREAIVEAGLPPDTFFLLETRDEVREMLEAEGLIDLLVPRGSNSLVRYIQENTNIPVLGHADGICHVYVDRSADLEKARRVVVDAKTQYAAVCNAAETLLIHRDVAGQFLPLIVEELRRLAVEVRCDESDIEAYRLHGVTVAEEADWRTEYGDLILSIKTVSSIEEAILHINEYSSRHTEAILTEDEKAFERFFAQVDSAGVFWNASTRFADGYRYGFGAEVGISTYKLHPRGPVGLDGLVTYKYKLIGDGHVVADYTGSNGKSFTHKPIKQQSKQ